MPSYGTLGVPNSIAAGDSVEVVNVNDAVYGSTPFTSERVAISGVYGQSQRGLRIRVIFSGNPGAFEIDPQESDDDTNNAYLQVSSGGTALSITAAVAGGSKYYAGLDLTGVVDAKFLRTVVKTLTNNVTVSILISQAP
jgi:hypothetical protein